MERKKKERMRGESENKKRVKKRIEGGEKGRSENKKRKKERE